MDQESGHRPSNPSESIDCAHCALGKATPGRCPFVRTPFPVGHVFFQQGDPIDAVHFLVQGEVRAFTTDADGNVVRQGLRTTQMLLDPFATRRTTHRTTAVAITPVEACVLPVADFDVWRGPRDGPTGALLDLALADILVYEREAYRFRRPAVARVASFLLDHLEGREPLPVQQQLIASLLDMRPETLSRALAKLREAGAITGDRGEVMLASARALADAVEDERGDEGE